MRPKRVLLLVGSPRGKKSTSTAVGAYLLDLMKNKGFESLDPIWIVSAVRAQEKISKMLEAVEAADMIFLAAPLYDDCQPYVVIKAMELIAEAREGPNVLPVEDNDKLFSVIVNCAFPEDHHTETVVRIYRKFAEAVGLKWGGSLTIRAGEALQGRAGKTLEELGSMAKRVKEALVRVAESLSDGSPIGNKTMSVIPESLSRGPFSFIGSLFIWFNNRMWVRVAKKKGEDVDARPYI